uniref:Opioid growth factor receptor (OGFr) conserved domain-containing protein n=1 Tax=Octopus bimaculoides TaxID=37653 RepID=A0A0L8HRP7_OCTBM|eukprot:XP_014770397.1 PREDICTED: opioid growth factor receptor-like protein 1 isoform X1 [Octopus bimaculoides]
MIAVLLFLIFLLVGLVYKYLFSDELQKDIFYCCKGCRHVHALPVIMHCGPNLEDDEILYALNEVSHPNLDFYQNRIKSEPNGDFIENILRHWSQNYEYLEKKTGYVEWLFPTPEDTTPHKYSSPLTSYESRMMQNDINIQKRYLRSFRMMLNFFGFQLTSSMQFILTPEVNQRFCHLQKNPHNYEHFTRIMISLKCLGHSRLQKKWVQFITKLINIGFLADAKDHYSNSWLKI